MIPRTLEPEVMESAEEARDYDAMDHGSVNHAFVADFLTTLASASREGRRGLHERCLSILDVGTGTALIPILLAQQFAACKITAADLSEEMLRIAQRNIEAAGLALRLSVVKADCKSLTFQEGSFDSVISNSIMHHLPDPVGPLQQMVRVLRPKGFLFVRDLLRPNTTGEVDRLVELYAANESDHARQMFHASLHAALTLEEIREAVAEVGLSAELVRQTSDRHWTLAGHLG
jgi:ubiquinone/menaquinone biosynthesis C-methylase UbiE